MTKLGNSSSPVDLPFRLFVREVSCDNLRFRECVSLVDGFVGIRNEFVVIF